MSETQLPIISRRCVLVTFPDGTDKKFEIQIEAPVQISGDECCCVVRADDVLFVGQQKVFGVDGIDALDHAIQFIDMAAANFRNGRLTWPDGSPYNRVPSGNKFQWGHLKD